ncbi:hypothetical protein V1L52_07765 [Treponema sp. HNW]|uniref:hypothetical protein n=1 Tax=Treponema sp. HNW TaxID=3116654 RepID=UPI003D1424F5
MILKNLIIPLTLANKRKQNSLKISDYPVFYYKNKNAQQENIKFGVRILFWTGMVGHGKNFKEAFVKLCENFDLYKKNNEYVPKPWEKKELEFASAKKILENENFAVEFFDKILGTDFYKGFYSDETYLEHFYCDVDADKKKRIKKGIIDKVKSYYNIDISDVYDFALPDVFQFIIDKKPPNISS